MRGKNSVTMINFFLKSINLVFCPIETQQGEYLGTWHLNKAETEENNLKWGAGSSHMSTDSEEDL